LGLDLCRARTLAVGLIRRTKFEKLKKRLQFVMYCAGGGTELQAGLSRMRVSGR
jgi:hypothetical protein